MLYTYTLVQTLVACHVSQAENEQGGIVHSKNTSFGSNLYTKTRTQMFQSPLSHSLHNTLAKQSDLVVLIN